MKHFHVIFVVVLCATACFQVRGEDAKPATVEPTPAPGQKFPYAIPVENKPGFVRSPYAPDAGMIDVRGFPTDTQVKDPYTGKIFLVPADYSPTKDSSPSSTPKS